MPMAHLWLQPPDAVDAWTHVPLDGPKPDRGLIPSGDAWVLLAGPDTRMNGTPLVTGIRVLRDRDELVVGGDRMFFSTESLATIAPFDGPVAVSCPRCRLEVVPGTPAVVCPGCRVVHHQSDELPCFTYDPRCAACDHATALDAGFRWTPEAL